MTTEQKKENRGGARKGSGRKARPIAIIPIRKINKAILLLHCARKYATNSGAKLKATGLTADGAKVQFSVTGEIPPAQNWHMIQFIEEPVFFARYFMLI